MSVATGRIQGGQIVVDGEGDPLPEGKRVTVIIEDDDEGFHLDEESVKALRAAQDEIRKGNYVGEDAVLKELD
jgi:hypothetical protein